ncbi:inner centromere protein [Haematobia irritans]|uniref:inner centromere protein n=1 Tax=Haematobia irritans TaxID=7368 RepID=UPI003F50917D
MDDLLDLYNLTETIPAELELIVEEWVNNLRVILWGPTVLPANAVKEATKEIIAASPQQTKKRVKRLTSLNEEDNEDASSMLVVADAQRTTNHKLSRGQVSPRRSKRSNAELLAIAENIESSVPNVLEEIPIPPKKSADEAPQMEKTEVTAERKSDATNLMPPPPVPAEHTEEHSSGRPTRMAKMKCEKNLKEPRINTKLRRPSSNEVKVKLEHEQRPSQIHEKISQNIASEEIPHERPSANSKPNDSIVILPPPKPATIEISETSDDDAGVQVSTTDASKKEAKNLTRNASLESSDGSVRSLRIKIKREKTSINPQEENPNGVPDDTVFKAPSTVPLPMALAPKNETTALEESSAAAASMLSSTTSSIAGKKPRKKKEAPRPIKVERFSDLDPKPSPVALRTRGSAGSRISQTEKDSDNQTPIEEPKRGGSIYEDAVETPTQRTSKGTIVNETVNLGAVPASDATMNLGPVPSDATFCTNAAQTTFQVTPGQTTFVVEGNPNATVTLNKNSSGADATFNVQGSAKAEKEDEAVGQRSFETAKDSSVPHEESLITEDESIEPPVPTKTKVSSSAKATVPLTKNVSKVTKANYKLPNRTNELFNPLAQSPVKQRVEAFENAAAAASEQTKRPLRNKKENVTPSATTTPVIGKLATPALGRFLTPTQSSNLTSSSSTVAKKAPTSASKAMTLTKSASSTLHRSNSTVSSKTLQRENSADDFRKGLHNLAEERKKQREQKHLLAAQQREAKERERAERMAKLAKEREEKRLLKQQEQEQKRRELDEIQRKLRLQQEEEAARLKAAKEREMLLQMKQQQQMSSRQKMMPPPAKTTSKYTFEMLHEDDSTDDEDKVSYKRPPPPSWSRSHKRGPYVLKQEYTPSSYIDYFFSVQPMTPDLKQIFPNIDARHLKRNSSVLWSTPPRYSELPKY